LIAQGPLSARLARRLREARVHAGLTVREAAVQASLSNHTLIVKYENGTVAPPLDRLHELARAYGTTPAALLAEHDAAVAVIAAIDQADAAQLAQLAMALEKLSASEADGQV
jgi:transcriptional regulator with XRE-family HTH domain